MKEVKKLKLRPFTKWCVSIGAIPSAFSNAYDLEEQMLFLYKFLRDSVIPAVNNNAEAVEEVQRLMEELQNYINTYFDNLDVQEEINNKLDEMAESGELTEIISAYLNTKAILTFVNVEGLKESTILKNGCVAKTLGYYDFNDGGEATYKIREVRNTDVVDNMFILSLENSNLVAELTTQELYIEQVGALSNAQFDNSEIIQKAVDYCITNNIPLKSVGGKSYLINESINLNDKIDIDFNGSEIITNSAIDMIVFNHAEGEEYQGYLKNIVINMNSVATKGIYGIRLIKKTISGIVIKNISNIGYHIIKGHEVIFENSHLYGVGTESIGLQLDKGDCHYKDIIMIDVHTAIVSNSLNFFSRIHAWIKTKELIGGSIFMRCSTATSNLLNQCYSDTYQYGFYIESDSRVKLVEHNNYNNQAIMDSSVMSEIENIYFLYYTDPSYSSRTSITNSVIAGLTGNDGSKANFTNLDSNDIYLFCDTATRIANFKSNFKANIKKITELLDSKFSVASNYKNQLNRIEGTASINLRLQATQSITGAQEITAFNVDEHFRPITESSLLIPVTDSSYNLKTYVFGYITESGNVIIRIPAGTTINTNDRLHFNKSYISVSSQT